MNLVLLAPDEIGPDGRATLHGRRATHLVGVLGVQVGSRVRVGIARGAVGHGEVVACSAGAVTLAVTPAGAVPAPPAVELVVALPRPKALTRLLGAVASIGVARIDLVNAWRVDKSYFASPRLAPAALAEAVWLGCEQGGTTWVPEVRVLRRFDDLLAELADRAPRCRLVAHPRAERPLEAVVRGGVEPTILALGPDGGWIDGEVAALVDHGFEPVSLGPWVLRTEVAAPVALAALALVRRLAVGADPGGAGGGGPAD